MTERDIVTELLESNPNQYATNGAVLLLRAEMKSEFHAVRSEMRQGFAKVDERFAKIDERFAKIDERFDQMEMRIQAQFHGIEKSLELIAQKVAILVARS